MKLKLDYTSPLDEAQVVSVAKQIKTKTKEMKSRVTLSKIIKISVIIFFIFSVVLISIGAIYGLFTTEKALKPVAKQLAAMPIIGSTAKWCFRNILLKFKDIHAILRSVLLVIGVPLVAAILLRILGGIFISRKRTTSFWKLYDDKVVTDELKNDFAKLKTLTSKTIDGAKPVKSFCVLTSLFIAGYFLYSMFLYAEVDASINDGFIFVAIFGLLLLSVALSVIIYGLLYCLRTLYVVSWNKNNDSFPSELEKFEERQRRERELREQEEKERKRLADLKDGAELYEKAVSGDTIDESLIRQAAEKGDPQANLYIGIQMITDISGLTSRELTARYSMAKAHFKYANDVKIPDGIFLYATSQLMTESHNYNEWEAILKCVRVLDKTKLSEECVNLYDSVIEQLVDVADRAAENERQRRYQNSYQHELTYDEALQRVKEKQRNGELVMDWSLGKLVPASSKTSSDNKKIWDDIDTIKDMYRY